MVIAFDNILNARDLGGIPLIGGRRVKPGLLLRSAHLGAASEGDLALLSEQYGVRHVLDMRDAGEIARRPDRPVPGAEMHHLQVFERMPGDPKKFAAMTGDEVHALFLEIYRVLAGNDHCAAAYGEFFRVLLSAGGAAVLWHCTQGKDRTGVAAILLLTALGADRQAVLADYLLSNEAMRPEYERCIRAGMSESELHYMRELLFVMPECVGAYFDRLEELYGGVDGYLRRRLGLTDGDFQLLRENYIE